MEAKMSKLDEIEKRNPFTVPEDFFQNLSDEIMNCLPEKKMTVRKKVTMWKKIEPWVYMAAMFIGAFFIIQSIQNSVGNKEKNQTNSVAAIDMPTNESLWSNIQISEEEFYQYIEEQLINDGYYDYMYNQVSLN